MSKIRMYRDKIYVAILWHMHQPWYAEAGENKCIMPWVRLHALKDYYDMPYWLSMVPGMKATINLVPSLLEQIEGYASGKLSDSYQDAFAMHPSKMSKSDREFIIKNFFSANFENFIATSPRYLYLSHKRNKGRFTDQELLDLQIHFELAWFGESMKKNREVKKLISKDMGFDQKDKQILLDLEKERLKSIIPMYRKMAESPDIELTTTPYYHPILPILCDFENIRRADPSSPMPKGSFQYPQDAKAQIDMGIEYFKKLFGTKPKGMWPSEGSVSEDIIPHTLDAGIKWIATDEDILWKSLGKSKRNDSLFVPYAREHDGRELRLFFRDRKLSDKIGFDYSKWDTEDAVRDFLVNIRGIADVMPDSPHPYLVSVILDGENAWEYFPDNGEKFLLTLYSQLVDADDIEPITFSEYLDMKPDIRKLNKLAPGSWISGNFRTWSGDPDKNRGWELVAKTRKILEDANLSDEQYEKAFRHIMIAEGSDWFWWYGEGNYTPYLDEFDRLFRSHLRAAIADCKDNNVPELEDAVFDEEPVVELNEKPISLIEPVIDGKETSFYEWKQAGHYIPKSFRGTMHGEGSQIVTKMYLGFNLENLFLRLNGKKKLSKELLINDYDLMIKFSEPQEKSILIKSDRTVQFFLEGKAIKRQVVPEVAMDDVLEIAIPFSFLGAKKRDLLSFVIEILHKNAVIETIPAGGAFQTTVPDESSELDMWYV